MAGSKKLGEPVKLWIASLWATGRRTKDIAKTVEVTEKDVLSVVKEKGLATARSIGGETYEIRGAAKSFSILREVLFSGLTQSELARNLGLSRQTINAVATLAARAGLTADDVRRSRTLDGRGTDLAILQMFLESATKRPEDIADGNDVPVKVVRRVLAEAEERGIMTGLADYRKSLARVIDKPPEKNRMKRMMKLLKMAKDGVSASDAALKLQMNILVAQRVVRAARDAGLL